MNPTKEQIEAVVEWWAERTFKTERHNNGDFQQSSFANVFASAPDDSKRNEFKSLLFDKLSNWPQEPGYYQDMMLSVDYDPNVPLREIGDKLGFGYMTYPCKTFTRFSEGKFIGRNGYGSNFENIGPES